MGDFLDGRPRRGRVSFQVSTSLRETSLTRAPHLWPLDLRPRSFIFPSCNQSEIVGYGMPVISLAARIDTRSEFTFSITFDINASVVRSEFCSIMYFNSSIKIDSRRKCLVIYTLNFKQLEDFRAEIKNRQRKSGDEIRRIRRQNMFNKLEEVTINE